MGLNLRIYQRDLATVIDLMMVEMLQGECVPLRWPPSQLHVKNLFALFLNFRFVRNQRRPGIVFLTSVSSLVPLLQINRTNR